MKEYANALGAYYERRDLRPPVWLVKNKNKGYHTDKTKGGNPAGVDQKPMWIEGRSEDVPRPPVWKEKVFFPQGSRTYIWIIYRHICLVESKNRQGRRVQRGEWDVPLFAVFGSDTAAVNKEASRVLLEVENAFGTKELSREDVHFLFVNDEVRLPWPAVLDPDAENVRAAFDERRRQSDLHRPFGKREDMVGRALTAPLRQDILEEAFDAMVAASKLSQQWATKFGRAFTDARGDIEMRGAFAVVGRKRPDSCDVSRTASSRRVAPPCPKLSTAARTLLAKNPLNFRTMADLASLQTEWMGSCIEGAPPTPNINTLLLGDRWEESNGPLFELEDVDGRIVNQVVNLDSMHMAMPVQASLSLLTHFRPGHTKDKRQMHLPRSTKITWNPQHDRYMLRDDTGLVFRRDPHNAHDCGTSMFIGTCFGSRIFLVVPPLFEEILSVESSLFKQIMYLFRFFLNGNMMPPGVRECHPFEGRMVCHGGPGDYTLFDSKHWNPQDYGTSVPTLHTEILSMISWGMDYSVH